MVDLLGIVSTVVSYNALLSRSITLRTRIFLTINESTTCQRDSDGDGIINKDRRTV